jgi:hypothetical protein
LFDIGKRKGAIENGRCENKGKRGQQDKAPNAFMSHEKGIKKAMWRTPGCENKTQN